jgi:septal ring factor EnvC (AmiA/AmiB activator)|tara:strand:+ start:317 stop:553 length:237 start_codon:yes stop_codon:yes gene_type:complete
MMSRDVWQHRDNVESRISKMEAHMQNIYHHLKRIDILLEKQNGRIRTNEFTLNRWKGLALGIVAVSSAISSLIAMAIR